MRLEFVPSSHDGTLLLRYQYMKNEFFFLPRAISARACPTIPGTHVNPVENCVKLVQFRTCTRSAIIDEDMGSVGCWDWWGNQ